MVQSVNKLVKTNGLYYVPRSTLPYSGLLETYHENGDLWVLAYIKNGVKHGPQTVFYNNGNVKQEATYKNGKLEGNYEAYHEDGDLYVSANYKNGKLLGPEERFHKKDQNTDDLTITTNILRN